MAKKEGVKNVTLQLRHKQLFFAIKKNIVSMIISSGSLYNKKDLELVDKEGNSPLYYGVHSEVITDFLLTLGANPN